MVQWLGLESRSSALDLRPLSRLQDGDVFNIRLFEEPMLPQPVKKSGGSVDQFGLRSNSYSNAPIRKYVCVSVCLCLSLSLFPLLRPLVWSIVLHCHHGSRVFGSEGGGMASDGEDLVG